MKPPAFLYHDPRTVEEAIGLLARLDNARRVRGDASGIATRPCAGASRIPA